MWHPPHDQNPLSLGLHECLGHVFTFESEDLGAVEGADGSVLLELGGEPLVHHVSINLITITNFLPVNSRLEWVGCIAYVATMRAGV